MGVDHGGRGRVTITFLEGGLLQKVPLTFSNMMEQTVIMPRKAKFLEEK